MDGRKIDCKPKAKKWIFRWKTQGRTFPKFVFQSFLRILKIKYFERFYSLSKTVQLMLALLGRTKLIDLKKNQGWCYTAQPNRHAIH